IECHFCTKHFSLADMHNHIGKHILCALRNIPDVFKGNDTEFFHIVLYPCGECRLEGCKTELIKTGSSIPITSDCPYHYTRMKYVKAGVYSKRTPCMNITLNCPLCPVGLNMQQRTF
ncbi:hypothetical protein BDQ12DRAFT_614826, partial [Crucibulum laeve]